MPPKFADISDELRWISNPSTVGEICSYLLGDFSCSLGDKESKNLSIRLRKGKDELSFSFPSSISTISLSPSECIFSFGESLQFRYTLEREDLEDCRLFRLKESIFLKEKPSFDSLVLTFSSNLETVSFGDSIEFSGLCRIFKPKLEDASKNEMMGDCKISSNQFEIVFPKEFLKMATYPVLIDPTLVASLPTYEWLFPPQRKVFYDGQNHFVFFVQSYMYYRASSDGVTFDAQSQVLSDVVWESGLLSLVNVGSQVFFVYKDSGSWTLKAGYGAISGLAITFSQGPIVYTLGNPGQPSMTIDNSNYLNIFFSDTYSPYGIFSRKSALPLSISSWQSVETIASSWGVTLGSGIVLPLDSGWRISIFHNGGLFCSINTGGGWQSPSIVSSIRRWDGLVRTDYTVQIAALDRVYNLAHFKADSPYLNWTETRTVVTSIFGVALSINTSNNDLYAFYTIPESDTIYYKKYDTSWGAETLVDTLSDPKRLISAYGRTDKIPYTIQDSARGLYYNFLTITVVGTSYILSLSDGIGASETRLMDLKLVKQDLANILEQLLATKSILVSLADFVNIGPLIGIKRTLTDILNIEEVKQIVMAKFISDVSNVSDQLFRAISKLIADETLISETFQSQLGALVRDLSDLVSIADSLFRQLTRALPDSLSVIDSDIRIQLQKIFIDSISITDSLRQQLQRFIFDSLTITDSDLRKQLIKLLSESVSISEVSRLELGKILSESLSISETFEAITPPAGIVRNLSDLLEILEVVSKKYLKSLSDLASVSDLTIREFETISSDSVSITSAIALLKTIRQDLENEIELLEILGFDFKKSISDSLAISEAVSYLIPTLIHLFRKVSMTSALQRTANITDGLDREVSITTDLFRKVRIE